MAYFELFAAAAKHVKSQGVAVTLERGKALNSREMDRFCSQSPITVPRSLIEFFAEMGDGFIFEWDAGGDRVVFASIQLPAFAELISTANRRLQRWTNLSKNNDFAGTKNPVLAKETALRMQTWLAIDSHGNGDAFCLDTSQNPSPVVLHHHDWFDGGTGANGHVVGISLLDFFTRWSKVCFQEPSSYWWPSVFLKSSGVDWESQEFRSPFRLS